MELIHQIFGGEVVPFENACPRSAYYRTYTHEVRDKREHFQSCLTAEAVEEYEKLREMEYNLNYMDWEASFAQGLKIGIQLMSELFLSDETRDEEDEDV